MNNESRICQNCKQDFVIEPDDFSFYEKMQVPPPTWCPECRMIRRFIWRNQRNFFRRPDPISGKEIFSSFPKEVLATIYDLPYWNSDNWEAASYGKDYDFSRPFFEQFREFLQAVPWPSRSVLNMVNSDYCDQASNLKNCYLCFDMDYGENSAYCVRGREGKDSLDLYEFRHSELSYEDYMVDESYRVFFSVNVEDCHEVWFSRNLIGCQNCFGCVNLRNKSYYIFNQPHTKESYAKFMKEFRSGSYTAIDEMKRRVQEFWMKFPMRFTLGINNMNCTGEHIEHSKNVHRSYAVHNGENLKYCQVASDKVSDSYDYTVWGDSASRIYESVTCGLEVDTLRFCYDCWPSLQGVEYSISCRSSSNLFGCVGLKKKQYCIFNKQYSKEEYEKLRAKIIEHMNAMPYVVEREMENGERRKIEYRYGEFFPSEFSPFAYNETIAEDFFPLTKEQAEEKGFQWREPDRKEYETTLDAKNLP
ncbi:MAG: hypothetical protein AAB518_03685, partial [Patescibacteria group bacterium]